MTQSTRDFRKPFPARRITLLASVAGVGAALLLAGPNGLWASGFGASSARAAE